MGGVKALNEFLAENSYIEGYVPSQADTAVFQALSGAPSSAPHALRWYNHIKSFGEGMKQFAKSKKNASEYTSGAAAAALTMMMMTLISSVPTTRKMTLRRRGLPRRDWLPTPLRSPRSLHSSPRPPFSLT